MRIRNLIPLSILLITASCGTVEVASDGGGNPAVAPVIISVSPENGPLEGGNDITLTGENFEAAFTVIMNGREITELQAPDENTIIFQAPDSTQAGQVTDILVYGDKGFGRIEAAYTYNPTPAIAVVAPPVASLAGGTSIEIRGSGFLNNTVGETTVSIGSLAATNVVVVDDTTITATTPSVSPDLVAIPQDIVVENSNGSTIDEDSFLFVRPGLLVATRRESSEASFGVSFYDIATKRLAPMISLDGGVGRMEFVPGVGLVMRLNRDGVIAENRMIQRLDFTTGAIEDLGPLRNGAAAQTIRAIASIGTQVRAFNNGRQFGEIDLTDMSFTPIGDTTGKPTRGCLAANGTASMFHMQSGTGVLSTFNTGTGAFTNGPPLSGFPVGSWSCYGAANIGGSLLAIFINKSEPGDPASLFKINTANGVAALESDLGEGYGALAATPANF
tara:strand:- start:20217 stop:21554 length:1338 start_codon:yes stop_codon:yes gene_type:complete